LYLFVPVGDVWDGTLAVDARVGPEVDQDNLAAQCLEVDRGIAWGVEPSGDALDIGCGAAAFELRTAVRAVRQLFVLIVDDAAEIELRRDLVGSGDLALQCAGVVGDYSLQRCGQIEGDRDREHEHDGPPDDTDLALTAAEGSDPLGDPLPGEGEDQQRYRGPDRERHGQRNSVDADGSGCAGHHDGGQHRPGAGHEQHPQGKAEAESAPALTGVELRNAGERLFEDLLELRKDQPDTDEGQRDDACPPERVLWQMQKRQQRRPGQGDHTETQDQAANHPIRAQRFREGGLRLDRGRYTALTWLWRVGPDAAAGLCSGEEDHR